MADVADWALGKALAGRGWAARAAGVLLVVLLGALPRVPRVGALHEDQVGMYDWHQQYIGRVTSAAFLTSSQRKRVYVATEEGAVAAINLRKGDIAWRKVLGEDAKVVALSIVGKYLVTLSGNGLLSAWALADGTLAWDVLLPALGPSTSNGPSTLLPLPEAPGASAAPGAGPAAGERLAVLFGGQLHGCSARTGEQLWSLPWPGEHTRATVAGPDSVVAMVLLNPLTLSILAVNVTSGAVLHQNAVMSLTPLDPASLTALAQPAAAWAAALEQGGGGLRALTAAASDSPGEKSGALGLPEAWQLTQTPLSKLDVPGGSPEALALRLQAAKAPGVAWLEAGGQRLLLSFGPSGPEVAIRSSRSATLGEATLVQTPASGSSPPAWVVVSAESEREISQGRVATRVVVRLQELPSPDADGDTALWRREEAFVLPKHRGMGVLGVWVNAYARPQARGSGEGTASHLATLGFRFLAVSADHAMSLLQQEEVVWAREEALASVAASVLSELPPERHEAGRLGQVAALEHSLEEWVKEHWLMAKVALGLATVDEQARAHVLRRSTPARTAPTRDRHGFRRLLVVLTASGKLLGLHTGSGEVLWTTLPSGPAPGASPALQQHLFVWREAPPGQGMGAPELAVLSCPKVGSPGGAEQEADEGQGQCQLVVLDAYSGQELAQVPLGLHADLVSVLPFTDASGRHLVLLAERRASDRAPVRLHLLPGSEDAADIFAHHKAQLYLHSLDPSTALLQGHRAGARGQLRYSGAVATPVEVPANELTVGSGFWASVESLPLLEFAAVPAWQLSLAGKKQVLAAVAQPSPLEVVHTAVRTMPDRSVQFKLASRNLLFVATTSRGALDAAFPGQGDESHLTALVVDSVTGQVVTKQVHADGAGPVHAVFSENWVVYHYFNYMRQRFEVSSLELLDMTHVDDGAIPALKFGLGLPGASNLTAPLSAFDSPRRSNVSVLLQSYSFAHPVPCLAVTQTRQGITPRRVLFATSLGQVVALDRRLLDPRRKVDPSPAERESGIMPYAETLPLDPKAFLTHKYHLEGIKGVASFPTRLESTTLIFAHGIDLFFIRLAPANVFDSLTEDFNFALLLVTMIALVVAILVAWVISQRQDLHYQWR